MIELSKKDLQVFKFTSKDEARPLLMHVLVRLNKEDGNIELIATDSYKLVIRKVKTDTKTFAPMMIHRDQFERIIKVIGKHDDPKLLFGTKIEDKVVLTSTTMRIDEKGITMKLPVQPEGNYPDIDKMLNNAFRSDRAKEVTLNANYLADVVKYAANDKEAYSVKVATNGVLEPVVITGNNTYAVVMPLKS